MTNERTMMRNFTEGPIFRQLINFSLPFVMANLLQSMYNLVDLAVVGQFVGSSGMSGVAIGGSIMFLFTSISIGFSGGAQVVIAQLVGKNDTGSIKRAIGTTFTMTAILSLAVTAIGFILHNWMLSILNTPPEALDQARTYLIICICGLFFNYGYSGVCAVLRGMGDSTRPLIFIAVASVTNLILDIVFIVGFDMGTVGAALATVIGQAVSFIFSLVYLYRRRSSFGFDFRPASFAIDRKLCFLLIRVALPTAFQFFFVAISMLIVSAFVNDYGVEASAVSGVGTKLFNFVGIITTSLRSSGCTLVGQNISVRKYSRVRHIFFDVLAINVVFAILMTLACLLIPRQMFSVFNREPAVLDLAEEYLSIYCHAYLAQNLMCAPLGLMQGAGDTLIVMGATLMDCVAARIGLSYLFGTVLDMGLHGTWLGASLASYVTVIIGTIYFFAGRWKKIQILKND